MQNEGINVRPKVSDHERHAVSHQPANEMRRVGGAVLSLGPSFVLYIRARGGPTMTYQLSEVQVTERARRERVE